MVLNRSTSGSVSFFVVEDNSRLMVREEPFLCRYTYGYLLAGTIQVVSGCGCRVQQSLLVAPTNQRQAVPSMAWLVKQVHLFNKAVTSMTSPGPVMQAI